MRRDDLLDWLGRHLRLEWVDTAAGAPVTGYGPADPARADRQASGPAHVWPDDVARQALLRSVQLGHVRGVEQQLAKVLAAQPGSAAWVAQARTLLQAF